jgi:hemerythrin
MQLEWTQKLSVGDKTIDNQHKRLFKQINEFIEHMKDGSDEAVVEETIEFMGRYINEHLRYEERYMQNHGYPEYEAHKKAHTAFEEKYDQLMSELKSGRSEELTNEVAGYLCSWWINHIGVEDTKFHTYISENPASHPKDEVENFHETSYDV